MGDVTMVCLRTVLFTARAQVLRSQLAIRRSAAPDAGAFSSAVTAQLAARSNLASLDAVRAAGLRGSLPARRAEASGACE